MNETCSISGCQKLVHARAMCGRHYWRVRRYGDPLIERRRGVKFGTEGKTTLHATIKPSLRDLSWAAGFIEGEGNFRRSYKCSQVSVQQVNREPIDRLVALFGGAEKLYRVRQSAIHKTPPNPTWTWYVSGGRARGVMLTLYALMTAKRKAQIRKALV